MLERLVEKSFATIRDMLLDRIEDVASLDHISPADVSEIAASNPGVFHVDIASCKYRVIYNLNAAFKLPDIKKYLVLSPEVSTFIVVTREKTTSAGKKGVDDALKKHVQFFSLIELQFNISHHELVPQHVPIRDEKEIDALLKSYMLKSRYHFPLIACSDPMARYLALKPGQMVRILRFSPSSGMFVSYRCCSTLQANVEIK